MEDGPGAGQVTGDGDAAADLGDGRVAAGPGGEVAQGAAAGGEQADPQLLVGGAAAAEDGEPGEGVGLDDAHLVGPPVADRPQRIGVGPQELGTDRLDRTAFRGDRAGCGTAPPHQPPHRRLHRLWASRASKK